MPFYLLVFTFLYHINPLDVNLLIISIAYYETTIKHFIQHMTVMTIIINVILDK